MMTSLHQTKLFHRVRTGSGNLGWFVLAAILMYGASSCTSDIAIEPTDFKSKLVVNAHISPDRYFEVEVNASVSALSPEPAYIPDGVTVMITDLTRQSVLQLFREDSTWVAPQSFPKPGHEYLLKVMAPNFDPVMAITTVPESLGLIEFNLTDYKLLPSPTTPQKNNLSYTVNLQLGSKQTSTGFLHVIFVQESQLNVGSVTDPEYEDIAYSITPEFPEENGYVEHVQEGVLVDLSKLSDPGKLAFLFRDYTIDDLEQIGDLRIEIRQVSYEYFQYFVSLARQLVSRQDPFAEPISVYSNIDSGLGCFSSFQSSFVVISFPE